MENNKLVQIVPYDQYKVEMKCLDVGCDMVYDRELKMMRPDWDKVAALGREWKRSTGGGFLQELELVKRYQAGDESVIFEIEKNLETLAYSTAGKFDKRMAKTEKLFVQIVPFAFSEEDIDEQFPKSVKAALKTYDPNHINAKGDKTFFSTWFFRRFQLDLKSLYKKYKTAEPDKIMTRKQYDQKGLSWSQTYIPIADKTGLTLDDFTDNELRWMSLLIESLPYQLSVNLRCKLLNIKDRKTDKNIRNSLIKKVEKIRDMRVPADFSLYSERFRKWSYEWRGGRRWPSVSDGYVGDIVLDIGLLKVKGFNDPTPAAVARTMDAGTELPEMTEFVPNLSNWYKDKDGLQIIQGSTGEYNQYSIYDLSGWVREHYQQKKQGREIPVIKSKDLKHKYYIYNHTKKVYCKNMLTRCSLLGYLAIKDAWKGAGYKIVVNGIQIM